MPSHCAAPEMFLFTDTKFKQELNTQNINTKQLKTHLSNKCWYNTCTKISPKPVNS